MKYYLKFSLKTCTALVLVWGAMNIVLSTNWSFPSHKPISSISNADPALADF